MEVNYKAIEPEQFVKVSEIFNISSSSLKKSLICFGAFSGSEIIGILLLIRVNEQTIRIGFFQILPVFRCSGIGSTLLKLTDNFATSIHATRLIAKYNDAENDIERCNHFFNKNNWVSGRYTHTKFRLKIEKFEKEFISRFFNAENLALKNNLIFLFFDELSEEWKKQIKEQSEKMLSNGLLPFNDLNSMIKELSVFAFQKNTLIAWSVVDSVKYNEASIRNTFVVNEFRNSGLGMYLWYLIFCKTNENLKFESIKWISFDFQKDNNRLYRLYTLLFGEISEKNIDYFISEKQLI